MSSNDSDIMAMRFGLGPAASGEDWSPDGMVRSLTILPPDKLLTYPSAAERLVEGYKLAAVRRKASGTERMTARKRYNDFTLGSYRLDVHHRIVWGATTALSFAERLLAFWSNHFTVSKRKPTLRAVLGPYEAEALLPHIGGRFADLLKAAVKHPAMLLYLDQAGSVGPNSQAGKRKNRGMNENLAREILELHTLGVHSGYGQSDVVELAKVMTGWTVDRATGQTQFRRNQAEPGVKTVLGRSYGGSRPQAGDFDAVLDVLAVQPATARHVATKLVTHFISDRPPESAIIAVAERFMASAGDLLQVYRALAETPEARSHLGAKARNDRDFLIALLRAAEVPAERLAPDEKRRNRAPLTTGALAVLRQEYWDAPSPAGWPEAAEEWLSPEGLAGRLQLIPRIVREAAVKTPEELMERALGSIVSERTRRIVGAASNREEAMALVLASPEFNRR